MYITKWFPKERWVKDIREEVHTRLCSLASLSDLRRLFVDTLNYNYANAPGPMSSLPSSLQEHIGDLRLIASHNGFSIFYARLDSLSRSLERAILQRLWTSDFCGLFVFSDSSQQVWEFANAKYVGQRRRVLRRIVVSAEERLRTAAEQIALLDITNIATPTALAIQAEHDRAFDVEAVTRKFFNDYCRVFGILWREHLFPRTNDPVWAHDFALQLLNRLMFLYFIQRKRWLGNDPSFIHSFWEAYKESGQPPDSFYDKWLSVLFFEAFCEKFQGGRSDRQHLPPGICDALAKAPYLNGGLFTPNELDTRYSFTVPDSVFQILFDSFDDQSPGFLEKYNFTIREDTPFDQEVAVDPEMIGKVYESLVNITFEGLSEEDLRGSAGIFYTQRVEIDLMCRLSLVDWLSNKLEHNYKPLLYQVIFAYEPDEKEEADQALTRENLWPKLIELLHEITVLDPACGSGSFLVGMLSILDDLEARGNAQLGISETSYERPKRIIGQNLYGVDVMPWAVSVAELRLWLQLAVETELEWWELKARPVLPNLSFKLRAGDSLVQEVGGINFALHRSHLDMPASLKGRLTRLKGEKLKFYNNDPSAQFKSESALKQEELNLFREILDARVHSLQNEVKAVESRLETARTQQGQLPGLARDQHRQASLEEIRVQEQLEQAANRLQQAQGARGALLKAEDVPFVWDIAYVEVFESEKGGFDIVIGNPPYVRQEKIAPPTMRPDDHGGEDSVRWKELKSQYKAKLQTSVAAAYPVFFGCKPSGQQGRKLDGMNDYYVYFYLHGLSLLNPQGSFCFITSNSWLDVEYGKDLQEFLLRHSKVKMILDNQVKRSFAQSDINTIIALLAPPDDRSDSGLEKTARFVMFKVPFEEAMHPVVLQEIEETSGRLSRPEFRCIALNQKELYKEGSGTSEERRRFAGGLTRYEANKWRAKYLRLPEPFFDLLERHILMPLGEICEFERGKTTGIVDFFIVDEATAKEWGIEPQFLSKIVTSTHEVECLAIDPLKVEKHVFVCPYSLRELQRKRFGGSAAYVRWGSQQVTRKKGGHTVQDVPWPEVPTVRGNTPGWHCIALKEAGDLIVPRLIREKFFFATNPACLPDSDMFFHGRFLNRDDALLNMALVNCTLVYLMLEIYGRQNIPGRFNVYGLELRLLPVPNPKLFDKEARDRITEQFRLLASQDILRIRDEIQKPDRRALDEIVFNVLGLSSEQREDVYQELRKLVEMRLEKESSANH